MDLALDGVQRDGEVCGVRGEDGDCGAWLEGVDGGFVGVRVSRVVGGVGGEGDVEAVVDFGDVLAEVFACGWWSILAWFGRRFWTGRTDSGVLLSRHTDHAQLADFASTAEVKEGEAYDADFLV